MYDRLGRWLMKRRPSPSTLGVGIRAWLLSAPHQPARRPRSGSPKRNRPPSTGWPGPRRSRSSAASRWSGSTPNSASRSSTRPSSWPTRSQGGWLHGRARPGRDANLLRGHIRLGKAGHRHPRRVRRPAHDLAEGPRGQEEPVVEGAPGHGCGHNAMCTACCCGHRRQGGHGRHEGTIKVFGSPAEEIVASRPYTTGLVYPRGWTPSSTITAAASAPGTGSTATPCSRPSSPSRARPRRRGRRAVGRAQRPGRRGDHERGHDYLREHLPLFPPAPLRHRRGRRGAQRRPRQGRGLVLRDGRLEDMYKRVVDCAKAGRLASGTELASM